jgi:cyclopropane fatty-acyl-phospholipid synthase-like methyltransferase
MSGYRPSEYWIERGKTYQDKFKYTKEFKLQERMLLDYMRSILPPFSSVLEIGCGFGRITKLVLSQFPNIQKYTAMDISPHQIKNAREYVKEVSRGIDIQFIVSDIKSLQVTEQYDLVIAAEVLLHVLPSDIAEIITKLVGLSSHHIINVDYYQEKEVSLAPHNFLHRYEKIYNAIPSIRKVTKLPIRKGGFLGTNTRQCIFHAQK